MLATRAGVPTAYVSLNARTVPLNYPQRVYSEIAAGVRVGSVVGLRPLLHSLLINSATRLKLRDFSSASGGLLAQSIGNLCHYYEENQVFDPHCELLWSLVLGEDLVWADYTYKRAQALDRIEELSRCFYTVNAGGMILLLDEVETTDQLWNYKSRLVAYDVMDRLCRFRHLWPVLAITERFTRVVKLDLPRASGNPDFREIADLLEGFTTRRFRVVDAPQLDRAKAIQLAAAVVSLYCAAYPDTKTPNGQIDDCVEEWNRNPSKNPRRLIRSVINRLDLLRPLREINLTDMNHCYLSPLPKK